MGERRVWRVDHKINEVKRYKKRREEKQATKPNKEYK